VVKTVASGYKQSLSYADETTYGSAMTVDQPFGLVQTISPKETNSLIKVRTLGGTRDFNNIVPGKFEVTGSLDYYLQGAAFMRMAIGEDTATTATIDSGPKIIATTTYLHIMGSAASPGADAFPSFTMELADEEDTGAGATKNLKRTYSGCRVDKLTLSGNVDEPVKVAVDWKAAEVTVATSAATDVTQYTQDPYVFYQGNVYFTSAEIDSNTTEASLADDIVANVNNFEVGISNNLESGWYIGGTTSVNQSLRGAKHIIPKGREWSLKLGLHFDDATMYRKFLGAASATQSQSTLAKYTCVIDLVRSGTFGTPTTTDDYMRMVMASATFDDITIDAAPEDIVSEDTSLFVKQAKVYVADSDSSYQ